MAEISEEINCGYVCVVIALAACSANVSSSPSTTIASSHSRSEQQFEPITPSTSGSTLDSGNESNDEGKEEKIPLYLAGFFAMGVRGNWDGSGILPAVDMAIEHVNERSDILTDYVLKMEWTDSEVVKRKGERGLGDDDDDFCFSKQMFDCQ